MASAGGVYRSREELVKDRSEHLDELLVGKVLDMRGAADQRVEVAASTLAYLDSILNTTFIRDISTQRASASKLSTISRITLALNPKRTTLSYHCALGVKGSFRCVPISRGRIRPDSNLSRLIAGSLTDFDSMLTGKGSIAEGPQRLACTTGQCFRISGLH